MDFIVWYFYVKYDKHETPPKNTEKRLQVVVTLSISIMRVEEPYIIHQI